MLQEITKHKCDYFNYTFPLQAGAEEGGRPPPLRLLRVNQFCSDEPSEKAMHQIYPPTITLKLKIHRFDLAQGCISSGTLARQLKIRDKTIVFKG